MASAYPSAYPTSFGGGFYSHRPPAVRDDEEEQDDDPQPPPNKLKESPSSKKRALGSELINLLSDAEIRDTYQRNLKRIAVEVSTAMDAC